MTSITVRLATAAVGILGALALALASCSSPAVEDGHTDHEHTDTPVISGEPAGYNADDIGFVTNMIPHHKQATELSAMVADRSDNPELVALADRIAAVQQPEINIMNVLLVQWKENPQAPAGAMDEHAGHGPTMSGMVDDATMARLESLQGPEFDRLWLESMISHHRGAVEMAEAEIADGENVDAIAMARTMVDTQQAEIEQMQQMLKGGAP